MNALSLQFRSAVHFFCYASGCSAFLARRRSYLSIIMYHCIPADSVRAFEMQLRYLKRWFDVVSLSSALKYLTEGRQTTPSKVVLTFDDGLRNSYITVYPILKRLGLPATFFACPGLTESGRWLWNQEVRARLLSLSVGRRAEVLHIVSAPSIQVPEVVEWMKNLDYRSRALIEATIRAETSDFKPTPEQIEYYTPMTWADLALLDPKLITIGSHTLTHPILSTMDNTKVEGEIRDSRAVLEERLQRAVEFFCYPNGTYNPLVVDCVRKYYQAAVTTEENVVYPGSDTYLLPRIPAANTTSLMAWRMLRPDA